MIHLYIPTGAMVRPRGSCNLLCKYHVLCSGVMMQDMYCSLLYIYNADSLLQFDLVILFLKFASIDSLCWNSRWFYQLMIVLILRLPILSNKCPLCSYFLLPLIDIRPYSEKTVYPETDWSNVRENDPQMLLYLGSLSVGRLEGGREGIRWVSNGASGSCWVMWAWGRATALMESVPLASLPSRSLLQPQPCPSPDRWAAIIILTLGDCQAHRAHIYRLCVCRWTAYYKNRCLQLFFPDAGKCKTWQC